MALTPAAFTTILQSLRRGQTALAGHTSAQKNRALSAVSSAINGNRALILAANSLDVAAAEKAGTSAPMMDRLALSDARIDGMIESLNTVIQQRDPLGEVLAGWVTPGGLAIRQVRVPLGVAAIIYESRPAVTLDAFALAYKSGNALLLRGSSAAQHSNKAIFDAIIAGLKNAGEDGAVDAVALLDKSSVDVCEGKLEATTVAHHSDVDAILNARGLIDVVLPRGGASLIRRVVENARVPVIETGSGVCHLYVDESADIGMAVNIAENGKLQRPGVCNALECFVVHKAVAAVFLAALDERFKGRCELRYDEASYGVEFLDTVAAVKIVDSVDEAIAFINGHHTQHSDAIVTRSMESAEKFRRGIDAACVYVNASTRFTDGGEFGFGLELGISTQKLHVRGPMGLEALTAAKYLIDGEGQIR